MIREPFSLLPGSPGFFLPTARQVMFYKVKAARILHPNSKTKATDREVSKMTIAELFRIAEKGGNSPERKSCSDKREAFAYMDVASAEYRRQIAKQRR